MRQPSRRAQGGAGRPSRAQAVSAVIMAANLLGPHPVASLLTAPCQHALALDPPPRLSHRGSNLLQPPESPMTAPLSGHHVAVLMGGLSSEREVSLVSGRACADALERLGARVGLIDAGRDLAQVLAKLKPDVCFNALHGEWGEDGCVQGVLETLGLRYTHSGVLASALAMDKAKAKAELAAGGLAEPGSGLFNRFEDPMAHAVPPPYVDHAN